MATDTERLLVRIEAQSRQFERAMAKASGTANTAATRIERRFRDMNRNLNASSLALTRTILAPLAAIASAREIGRAADSFTRIENALRVAGLEGEAAAAVFDRLFDAAQRNAAPIESLVELYGRAALVQNELGVSTEELLRFTEGVAAALRVSGKSAAESSGALLQLSQALGSGVVRAEEFNSLLEGALPIAQATARGLEEAGGSVAKLRTLVIDGKVSSEAFFRAFEAGQGSLEALAETTEITLGGSFEQLRNSLTLTVGQLNGTFGVTQQLGRGLENLAEAIADASAWILRNADAIGKWGDRAGFVLDMLGRIPRMIGRDSGLQNLGEMAGFTDEESNRVRDAFDGIARYAEAGNDALEEQLRRKADLVGGLAGAAEDAAVTPVSLNDFAASDGSDSGGTGRSKKSPEDRFADDITRIRERTAALLTETAAIGKSTYEREKELAVLDLTNEARRVGVDITPQLTAAIDLEAEAYARAAQEAEVMQEQYRQMQELQQLVGDQVLDFFSSVISGSSSVEDALQGIVDALARAALQATLLGQGPLAGIFGTSNPSGGVGGLLGNIFGGFRASGGPVSAGKAYVVGEKRPEIFVPSVNGTILPNARGGGSGQIMISLSPGLEGQILKEAAGQALRLDQQSIASYDRRRQRDALRTD